jgi:hypothetical protein
VMRNQSIFSADEHLAKIREAAYYIYGKKQGSLTVNYRYWIEGENEILARIEQGDIKLFLSDDFINKRHQ